MKLPKITKEELLNAITDGVTKGTYKALLFFSAGYIDSGAIKDSIAEGTRQAIENQLEENK